MRKVHPLKTSKDLDNVKTLLEAKWKFRDLMLIQMGVTSALRASDLTKLQIKDVVEEWGRLKKKFRLQEKKTGKRRDVNVSPNLVRIWEMYSTHYPALVLKPDNYLFFRLKSTTGAPRWSEHITVKQCNRIVKSAFGMVDSESVFGSHSLRKTAWRILWKEKQRRIEQVQHLLNHSSPAVTLLYLGITDEEQARDISEANL